MNMKRKIIDLRPIPISTTDRNLTSKVIIISDDTVPIRKHKRHKNYPLTRHGFKISIFIFNLMITTSKFLSQSIDAK